MASHSLDCPDCGKPIDYWRVQCRCGRFIGFPNWRAAQEERGELAARYDAAKRDASDRNILPLLTKLEALAEQARPVIAMSFAACDDILRSRKYRNYDQRVGGGERDPAPALNHSDREMAGEKLYPMYSQHINYAALSLNGRGPESYGPVAVQWQVTPMYLGRRASLLEDNSFTFFGKHALGRHLSTPIPPGYRAIWDDRAKLVVAKLAPDLTSATGENKLPGLLLKDGGGRAAEEFIEVAIYASATPDGGLDTEDVDLVTVQKAATTSEENHRVDLIRDVCANRHIVLVE
jgi:hypothetical protein